MRISMIGLGKLGSPMAACFASKGFTVVGADLNESYVNALNEGRAPVFEPGLAERIGAGRAYLSATVDTEAAVAATDATFLIVPTPSGEEGGFSLQYVLPACESIGRALRSKTDYHLVVLTSTVMPGATGSEVLATLEKTSGKRCGEDFGLCYSPEFIALGNVIRDLLEPDMVLIGESDARAGDILEQLHSGVCENDPPFRRMSLVNAELTKIAVNTYVTMKISYANTLADLCERLSGADVEAVTEALGLDSRIGRKYLRGAIAYGGPCFPRDNKAFGVFARDHGAEPLLAEATDLINSAQTDRLARVVQSRLKVGDAVGVLGLAYKPDTGVIDESPGVALARLLGEAGYEVHVYDPVAMDAALDVLGGLAHGSASAADVLTRSAVTVITTPWPEFAELPIHAIKREGRPVVIDCWRLLPDEGYEDVIEIVRLGRALEESTPV
jgi:UDPglucose 6-dehydrogenase